MDERSGNNIVIDDDDIGGVVMGPNGPEAGVWVIAETDDLPTRFVRSVVTDDEGRYVIPDLPEALAARAASVPSGEFLTAFGRLRPAQFSENRLPTLAELDAAAPNHPVYLHVSFDGPAVTNTLGRRFSRRAGSPSTRRVRSTGGGQPRRCRRCSGTTATRRPYVRGESTWSFRPPSGCTRSRTCQGAGGAAVAWLALQEVPAAYARP